MSSERKSTKRKKSPDNNILDLICMFLTIIMCLCSKVNCFKASKTPYLEAGTGKYCVNKNIVIG